MSKKKDTRKHGIFGVSNTIYNTQSSREGRPSERTHLNVHDDNIWGTQWTSERRRLARELDKKYSEGEATVDGLVREELREKKALAAKVNASAEHEFSWPKEQPGGVKYHVSPDGIARRCNARSAPCPYGSDDHVTIRDEQLKFLSSMGYSGEERQNIIGHWIKDQQNTKREEAAKVAIEPHRSLRQIVQFDLMEELNGHKVPPKTIEVEAVIDFAVWSGTPAKLSRKIGNTKETPWKDHSYWSFDPGVGEERVIRADHITDTDVDDWVETYITYNVYTEPEKHDEIREELRYQIKEILKHAEVQAHKVDPQSVHYSPVPLEFSEGMIPQKVNFTTSSFSPSTLDNVPVEGGGRAYLAEGFEIFEKELGSGSGGWKAVKDKNSIWSLEIVGSRGDKHHMFTADPEEAKTWFKEVMGARITEEDFTRQRLSKGISTSQGLDLTKTLRVDSRANFVSELMRKDALNEKEAKIFVAEEVYNMETATGQESLF